MNDVKISFRCPGCDESISFLGEAAGKIQSCPECGGWVDVPGLVSEEEPLFMESMRQFRENAILQDESIRQNAVSDRLLKQSEESHQEWRRQLQQSARYQDLAEETFAKLASLVTRWEGLTNRLERMLDESKRADS